ncbi:MAG: GlsB/YeaQ/YmgE family stress response membrane protein [Chloroflexota bacterium]|nr:GlsB/YeaQ/YmgE family stress response membrane protein [Chloroflexota bacterium]
MQQAGPIVWLVMGLVIGWLCGALMKGNGYGLLGDAIVGALGVLVGVWVFRLLAPDPQRSEPIGWIVAGIAGAVIFVATARLLTRRTAPSAAG